MQNINNTTAEEINRPSASGKTNLFKEIQSGIIEQFIIIGCCFYIK